MINLYNLATKTILINPFRTPYKNVPYTALFYHTMTLKDMSPDLHTCTTLLVNSKANVLFLRYYNIDPPGLLESTDPHTCH